MLFDISEFLDRFSGPGKAKPEDLLADSKRKAWHQDNKVVPRCDFRKNRFRLNSRGVMFISLWKRSIYGLTLDEIKKRPDMPQKFADELSPFIRKIIGASLGSSGWAIVTPPPRRHLQGNFAQAVASLIARQVGIPFYPRFTKARNRQRICAHFDIIEAPPENNIIVFDDICTTGSTFIAMEEILSSLNKNRVYIAGINNH